MTVTIAIPFAGDDISSFQKAVRSVFAQTYGDWKLLLINDGASPVLTAAAAAVADPRVTHMTDGVNRGLVARLNQIAGLADTEYLARMDADDMMTPERIKHQLSIISSGAIDVLSGHLVTMDENEEVLGELIEGPVPTDPRGFLVNNALSHATVLGRTSWFRDNPYRPISRAEDKELWLRTNVNSVFVKDPRPVYFYRTGTRFNRVKLLANVRGDRAATWPYAKQMLGPGEIVTFIARSYAKQALWSSPLGPAYWPRHLRRQRLVPEPGQLKEWRAIIHQIKTTHVPGWSM